MVLQAGGISRFITSWWTGGTGRTRPRWSLNATSSCGTSRLPCLRMLAAGPWATTSTRCPSSMRRYAYAQWLLLTLAYGSSISSPPCATNARAERHMLVYHYEIHEIVLFLELLRNFRFLCELLLQFAFPQHLAAFCYQTIDRGIHSCRPLQTGSGNIQGSFMLQQHCRFCLNMHPGKHFLNVREACACCERRINCCGCCRCQSSSMELLRARPFTSEMNSFAGSTLMTEAPRSDRLLGQCTVNAY